MARRTNAARAAIVTVGTVLLGAATWSGLSFRDLLPAESTPLQVPPAGALGYFAVALVTGAYAYFQLRQESIDLRDELTDAQGKQAAIDALVLLRNEAIDELY